ncbi:MULTISPECIES: hypothetical protein [unclassified Polaribacter]|uniref:hypothetical protein n=1 Tax=unclassified Polaribacter TaxID=196858 RepID=UPI0011BDDCDC|nr:MULTISPECIES: hypothetical protein [unclassified Polaribacter]TXD53439.1 hypothetical protein ES043_04360 [Polaribacter sp. IC063]TXD61459.1 hypothetical protein ES044_04470 [Polaribacter sp. IC066]
MKNRLFFIVTFFIFSISLNAQIAKKKTATKPTSIYTISNVLNANNSFSTIHKKLKLNNFNFVYVDLIDLDTNTFSFNFDDLGKNPTTYIYDDYEKYRNENLLKGFIQKNDPSYWNLQCPQPNLHPYE